MKKRGEFLGTPVIELEFGDDLTSLLPEFDKPFEGIFLTKDKLDCLLEEIQRSLRHRGMLVDEDAIRFKTGDGVFIKDVQTVGRFMGYRHMGFDKPQYFISYFIDGKLNEQWFYDFEVEAPRK